MSNQELLNFAREIRRRIIEAAYRARQGVHIGGAMSMAEILAVLYGRVMRYDPREPLSDERDRLILSKGHDCLGLYAAINALGVISGREFADYLADGGFLPVHTVKNIEKGIECTSGSLGMGLSFGIGKALAAKLDGKPYKTFVVVGDGECNEGSVWEAAAAAAQYKLDNLILIVDRNGLQGDGATAEIMDIDIAAVLTGFGWSVSEVDGHDVGALSEALAAVASKTAKTAGIPQALVANTIKGKGVSFMENNNAWHHGRLSEENYLAAKKELCGD